VSPKVGEVKPDSKCRRGGGEKIGTHNPLQVDAQGVLWEKRERMVKARGTSTDEGVRLLMPVISG